MFETDKIYRFADGRSVVVERRAYDWKFIFRDTQKYTIWDKDMNSEDKIIEALINLERDNLADAIDAMKRFYPEMKLPSDEVLYAGVIAGLEEYNLMDDAY